MTTDTVMQDIEQLKEAFGEVATAVGSCQQTLILIKAASLPKGCTPAETPVLLVMQPSRPLIYVKSGIKLPNGRDPQSTSIVQVEGESWMQFSYSFSYDETLHTLVQFVGAALNRFKKNQ
jgi:hypothetical protein